jgi:sugar phosphate permease
MNHADTLTAASPLHARNRLRFFQFGLLLLAAGAIYPLLYLRQNFETTILQSFRISSSDLGVFYSMLGVVYAVSYLPSGWLADRFPPRLLISFLLVRCRWPGAVVCHIPGVSGFGNHLCRLGTGRRAYLLGGTAQGREDAGRGQ